MESFSTKFSGLRETVPDTADYILLDKIGMVREYTREYTQQIRNKYQVYRVYVYLGHLLLLDLLPDLLLLLDFPPDFLLLLDFLPDLLLLLDWVVARLLLLDDPAVVFWFPSTPA